MLSKKTCDSLAQFLMLQDQDSLLVLLSKHGLRVTLPHGEETRSVANELRGADDAPMWGLLQEIFRTWDDLRYRITPRYRFDERWDDLRTCLQLDGYEVVDGEIRALDASVADSSPIGDLLTNKIRSLGLPRGLGIVERIDASTEYFRKPEPDYNACVANLRIALESLVVDGSGALARKREVAAPEGWGACLRFLRESGILTEGEERALAGVYTLVSHGSHRPLGGDEREHARFARALALHMSWFVTQKLSEY